MYNGITKAQTETASNDACVNITSNIQLTEFKPVTDESIASII